MQQAPLPSEKLPHPVIDNHTHYDMVLAKPDEQLIGALDEAESVGVGRIVQVGCDVAGSQWAVWAAHQDSRVVAAVALHPNEAPLLAQQGQLDNALGEIEKLAQDSRVRAIGETGLDYFRTGAEGIVAQQESFRRHIELAKKYDLALMIHDRDAHDDVVAVLQEVGAPERTIFHCYSGDEKLAAVCNENGWYMSFAGTVTFKNAQNIRDALHAADRNLILCETDAPFLTPDPYRGKKNSSYMTAITARFIAEELGEDLKSMCQQLWNNTIAAYGEWDD
ncbi:MAG: TatD family hydrolase [Micrococcaceae bacterium]